MHSDLSYDPSPTPAELLQRQQELEQLLAGARAAAEQRSVELAMINSIQQGLASQMDMQAIYELVGDKIREIFGIDTTYIISFDPSAQTVFSRYYMDRGTRRPAQ